VDSERFDAVTRALGNDFTRRGALGVLAGIAGLRLDELAAKRKHRGKGRKKRGKADHRKQESGSERASPGKSACRDAGHPCEGNQECCNPGTTICVASGPGAAARCTPCPDGQIACANKCIPACTALDQCHDVGKCDPATGQCDNPNKPDGAGCNDGNACTRTDSCQAGVCVGANPVVCTAKDQCHVAGVCDPATGVCSNPIKNDGAACDDGNACTRTDTCQNGECVGSNSVVCSAQDQCHVAGTCDSQTGKCSNPQAPDGTRCTVNGGAGSCVSGTCEPICHALGQGCSSASECCGNGSLTCAKEHVALDPTCCVPIQGACSAVDDHCCGIDFGRPDGSPAFDSDVQCIGGKCCQGAGEACRTQADCCTSGVPLTCTPTRGDHVGFCTRQNLRYCYQPAGTPCTSRCQCGDGFCVRGMCSATPA
jgi:hypothetical protein